MADGNNGLGFSAVASLAIKKRRSGAGWAEIRCKDTNCAMRIFLSFIPALPSRRIYSKDAYRRSSGVKPVPFISGNYVFEIARMKVRIGQHVRIELINHIWICISR